VPTAAYELAVVATTSPKELASGVAGGETAAGAAAAAALGTANRWGRISAGFAGGRAAGQVVRKADDAFCAVAGAVLGGAAAASTVAEMPSQIAVFVGFTVCLEVLSPKSPADGAEAKPQRDVPTDAKERARQGYARRHAGDSARLRALGS